MPAVEEPIANEAPLVVEAAAEIAEPMVEPQIADEPGNDAPTMARNLFNEMQEIPRPPSEDDATENEPMPVATVPSNQIPADYYPGPDEEEMDV